MKQENLFNFYSKEEGTLLKVRKAKDRKKDSEASLFEQVCDSYSKKLENNKRLKNVLFWVCLGILCSLILSFICSSVYVICSQKDVSVILSVLIPEGVTIITSVISIIIIIAKYLFPQDEDKAFADLIKVLKKD